MSESMGIVITGGSGLIGRALAQELAGVGHRVRITTRNPDMAGELAAGIERPGAAFSREERGGD